MMRSLKKLISVIAPAPAAPGGRPGSAEGAKQSWNGRLLRRFTPRNDALVVTIAFCIVLFVALFSYADEPSLPFAKGETITYAIKKMGIKAGEATLTFKGTEEVNGKKTYLIIFKADGFNFFDEERIYVDTETYAPVMVLRNVDIFGSKEKIGEEYLTEQGKIKITKIVGTKTTEQIIEKKGQVDNIYGVIYRYRHTGSVKIGDQFALNLPTRDVMLKVQEAVELSAAGKKYNAFYVSSDPSKYQIWFDTSDKKIPLRITGAVGMANTTMYMTGYESGK